MHLCCQIQEDIVLIDNTRRVNYEKQTKNKNKFFEVELRLPFKKIKEGENNAKNISQTTEQQQKKRIRTYISKIHKI